MPELKFRIPCYRRDSKKFSHFTYWGRINHKYKPCEHPQFTSPATDNFTISTYDEQYTGLKDKNDKEDYVGNIWEVEFNGKKIKFVREVELTWQGYVFDFRCLDGQISPVHANVSEDGEIIGNIHE